MCQVSIMMACHNASAHLPEAVNSVLEQTYQDFELIIVDDASTDASLAIARDFAARDARVTVHALPRNLGPAAARNHAIGVARGNWIANLDADDRFLRDKLARQMLSIDDAGDNLILLACDSYQIDESGKRLAHQQYPGVNDRLVTALEKRKRFPAHSSLLYRAETIKRLGGFNERYLRAQDYDLQLRCIGEGKMASVSEPLVEYRLHDQNISRSSTAVSQATYSYAAGVCHALRRCGQEDPSTTLDEAAWQQLLAWLGAELTGQGYPGYQASRETARRRLREGAFRPVVYLAFLRDLLGTRGIGHLVSERLSGAGPYRPMARKWLARQATGKTA